MFATSLFSLFFSLSQRFLEEKGENEGGLERFSLSTRGSPVDFCNQ